MQKDFTEKDFTVHLNKVEVSIGDTYFHEGIKGKVYSLTGNSGDDYCMIELEREDSHGCKILELKKSAFNYTTKPQ